MTAFVVRLLALVPVLVVLILLASMVFVSSAPHKLICPFPPWC
jgi:hypothetical protein